MKWKERKIRGQQRPWLYEGYIGKTQLFSIEPLIKCFYLHDLRLKGTDVYNGKPPTWIFDTLDNAKQAAIDVLAGKEIQSNTKDVFSENLSSTLKEANELIDKLLKL